MDHAAAGSTATSGPPSGFVLLIALLALCAGGKAILYDTLDPDCFWHLRVAEQLHRDGIGPLVDHLSFASSRTPWTPYSWLAELGMGAIWNMGGYRLAVAVQAVMQAGIVLAMAEAAVQLSGGMDLIKSGPTPSPGTPGEGGGEGDFERQASLNGRNHHHRKPIPVYPEREPQPPARYLAAVVATAAGTFLSLAYLSFRPVTAAILLLWIITALLLRDRRLGERSRAVWLVVPLTALLANIHLFVWLAPAAVAAMVWGAMLEKRFAPGAADAARRCRRYALLLTMTILAAAATPMLPGTLRTAWFYSAHDAMVAGPAIAEMQFFARGPMGAIGGGLVLGIAGCCLARWRGRLRAGEIVCLLVGAVLLLKLGRFAPIFAMAAIPALAATLPPLSDRLLRRAAVAAVLAMVLSVGLLRVAAAFPGRDQPIGRWLNRNGVGTPGYPCAAADFVDHSIARSTGRVIDEFSWGGFLEWRLGDRYQVLLDGRTQVFPPGVWRSTYLGSDADLQRYLGSVSADAALLPVGNSRFEDPLKRLGWRRVYQDDRAQVLTPPEALAKIE